MNRVDKIDVASKTVILRCDLNVPVKDGVITDNSKIKASLQTINYLLDNNCKVVILSHFGRVKTEEDKKTNSLVVVAKELCNLLGRRVKFLDKCVGEEVKKIVDEADYTDVILLENTRFTDVPEKKESANDEELAKFWASLGDIYVNDAFGSSHREHSSTAAICKYLPNAVGFLVATEIAGLNPLISETPHPFTVFMGGAKVDDKLPIIEELIKSCDYLLLGGGIANSFLKASGEKIKDSLACDDKEILSRIKKMMKEYKDKIILPVDFVWDDKKIMDLGEKSIEKYKKYINESKIIFVNGTCGKYEDEKFSQGTINLFNALKESSADVYIGGGDTASAVNNLGFTGVFKYVSSGGGATLEYIAYKKLKALEWMK